MIDEKFEQRFSIRVDDLEETVFKCRMMRPFVDRENRDGELFDAYVSRIESLIEKTRSMTELIDEFLAAGSTDRAEIDKARKLVAQANGEIAYFHGRKEFSDIGI